MAKIKHVSVGEALDSTEWAGDDIHTLTEDGEIIVSAPPSGFHKIYGLYAKKVGNKYHLMMVVEAEPE